MARYFEMVRDEMRGRALDREAALARTLVACSTLGTMVLIVAIATVPLP